MKKKSLHISLLLLILLFAGSCSTKKNTAVSRKYHSITTRFNVFFNGSESYKDGIENIEKANKDDFSQILYMYPISNKANASAATSNMDRAIEKCRKSIKLHSIKKKPAKNYKQYNDPKYQAFYNQTEFNPALKEAWMMLGKAEFHKGDFLGSVGTFSYISRHFATVPEIVAESQIWTARAYTEMDWMYEAEEMLGKVNQDQLNKKNTGLFAAVNANLLLRKKQYRDAVPFLKLAIETEKNKKQRTRFNFIMAQLLERTGDKSGASEYYSKVIKSTPPYEMDFNARINKAQLVTDNPLSIEKDLKRMAKSRNNKDYLDQIYAALGNVFLHENDTAKAIENYQSGIKKSTRNGIDKGVTLLKLGDLYYGKKEYIKAQPCYDEASKIFTNDYYDYQRLSKRADILGELVHENDIVVLQDSLQQLALLPESERLAAINRVIDKIKKDEETVEEQKNNMTGNSEEDDNFTMPTAQIGGEKNGDWYFYNSNSINTGKADFKKKWGSRKLEDNWRRSNKSASLFADNTVVSDMADSESKNDSLAPMKTASSDKKNVDYYLNQIPFSSAQRKKSDEQIADALYKMGMIYKDKIEDYPLAYNTFDKFRNRFGNDERVVEALFQCYLMASKETDNVKTNLYRNQIISLYPSGKYAELLSNPNYIQQLRSMYAEQDSLYNRTYSAYTRSDFQTVFSSVQYMKNKYPLSGLMPKFEFLNALSVGKTEKSDKFENSLTELVEKYPESDVSAMSKDILALMKQGNVAQLGKTHGSLLSKRVDQDLSDKQADIRFSDNKEGKHRLMLITDASGDGMNKLLYNLAIFNFSRFMIKDFDFSVGKVDSASQALSVTNLESYDEVLWYQKTLRTDKVLSALMDSLHIKEVPISEDNFGKLKTLFTLNDYLTFREDNLLKDKPKPIIAATKTATPDKKSQTKTPDLKTTQTTKAQSSSVQQPTIAKDYAATVSTQPVDNSVAKSKTAVTEPPKVEEPVIWYKDMFAYRPNAEHFVAFFIPTGKIDYAKIQKTFDTYNAANYGMMNLKISLEDLGKQKFIILGPFTDVNVAKSYFLRVLKEPSIVEAFKGINKRNLIGTRENLNIMLQKDALNIYFEFMKEFYLK